MELASGIKQAYERKWSMINSFTVNFTLPELLTSRVGNITDDINLNIISLTTPDISNSPIEEFIANRWMIHNGRDELYRFNITFRDQNQLLLYRKFSGIYSLTKDNYFDDVKMSVLVSKDPDWLWENHLLFMELGGVLVEGISNLSFSNDTESQIAEFTVNFKCNNVLIR